MARGCVVAAGYLLWSLLTLGLVAAVSYLLGQQRAFGADRPRPAPPVVRPAQAPPLRPGASPPAPLGTPPGPNFQWRYLPGIGWGWVQDGVTLPPAAVTAPKLQSGFNPGPACDT